jgi:hypothetical protein
MAYDHQIEERLWAKVDKNGPLSPRDDTPCWLWTGGRNNKGYPMMNIAGRSTLVHRVTYELANGPIPDGSDGKPLKVDHRRTCPKNCVNPEHLRAIPHKQNLENREGPNANSKSGVRGVWWNGLRKKWVVQVTHYGRRHSGGSHVRFVEAEAAAIALRNRLFTCNDADRGL